MSIIAVRRFDDKIVMSADEQTSWGNEYKYFNGTLHKNDAKLFQVNDMTVGASGSVYETSLLRVFSKTHRPSRPDIESILDFLVEFVDWGQKKDKDFKVENHYILIIDNEIFQCLGLNVSEVGEFNAVGSGMFLSIGAMMMGADTIKAVDIAKEIDLYCGGGTITFNIPITPTKTIAKT